MNDTPQSITERLQEELSYLSGSEKVIMACSMFDFAKELARASIIHENPLASEGEIRKQLLIRFYRADFSPQQIEKILNQ